MIPCRQFHLKMVFAHDTMSNVEIETFFVISLQPWKSAKKCLIIFCCPGFLHDFGMFSHLEPQIELKHYVVSITAKLHRQCIYTFGYEGISIWEDAHPKAWSDLRTNFFEPVDSNYRRNMYTKIMYINSFTHTESLKTFLTISQQNPAQ